MTLRRQRTGSAVGQVRDQVMKPQRRKQSRPAAISEEKGAVGEINKTEHRQKTVEAIVLETVSEQITKIVKTLDC